MAGRKVVGTKKGKERRLVVVVTAVFGKWPGCGMTAHGGYKREFVKVKVWKKRRGSKE